MWTSWKLLLCLCFLAFGFAAAASVVQVFAYVGEDAKVSCEYSPGYESYEKYICADHCRDEDVLVTTARGSMRYSISDDRQSRTFTVTISNVTQADAGKYWCAVSRAGMDLYTEVRVHTQPAACCDIVHPSVQVHENNNVSISCTFRPELVNSFKYMCRGSQLPTCRQQALVSTDRRTNGRFSVRETQREFIVDVTSVTKQDAGSYLCGVARHDGFDVFSHVHLSVTDWCCVSSHEVSGLPGQSVTLHCPYPAEDRPHRKFLCKGEHRHTCETVVTSETPTERFRLQDQNSSSFSVSIMRLREADAGTYWCGFDSQWTPGKYYTKIHLSLDWCCVSSHEVSGLPGQSVTLHCPYPAEDGSHGKFLCKGEHRHTCETVVTSETPTERFRLQDQNSSSFSVSIMRLREADAGTYWCGFDSQWTPGKYYTKIHLSLEYFKSTVSPKRNRTSESTLHKGSDAAPSPFVLYVLPGLLLILVVATAGVVYKYSCLRAQGDREINNTSCAKEDTAVHTFSSNQKDMKAERVDACCDADARSECNEVLYENYSDGNIYTNC